MNNHSIPKSPELERETLAILIQNPGEGLHRKLQEEFFTHPNNLFFSVISALNTRASIATVTDELEKSGLLNGGLAKSVTDLFRLEILPKELFDHNVERL